MARIDDDRESQRANERLLQEMRKQELRAKDKASADNAFAQRLRKSQGEQQANARARNALDQAAQGADALSFEALLLEAAAESSGSDPGSQAQGSQREQQQSLAQKLRRGDSREAEHGLAEKGEDSSAASYAEGVKGGDRLRADAGADGRAGDQRDSSRGLNQKGEDLKQGAFAGKAARGAGPLETDQDGGSEQGGKGSGQDSKGGNPGGVPAGFRFNPALMAPVPVAQAKPAGSERLRALANEIAQKIVERIRVGTNAAGAAEFQIDLRSNVLSGLSIKVSGGNGKIRATFSGNDKEILRLLRDQAETLKAALGGRGLTLEELKIEERA